VEETKIRENKVMSFVSRLYDALVLVYISFGLAPISGI
jgi:hypothetical protein